ncbi:hypothetical protein E1263_20000 [Kribbella antibiotica]|uniref:Uncharacterized protein n=1 Tax=Kribbella antibiotica TaxID=190195 RepID=A0A4R4ZJI2_9ACTN|nr:hypothetical protein [Kribbella antibiotica]TDD58300.1 hypothetical protein E1263_20000 [Kribbella antibiotica]
MVKRWLVTGVVLLAGVGLTGCAKGSTLAELGSEIKQVGTEQLTEAADTGAVKGTAPVITDDASADVPCGSGKAKRVFAGSFPYKPDPDIDTTLDFGYKAVLATMDTGRYKLTKEPDSDDTKRREFVFTGQEEHKVTFTFVLTGGAAPSLALRAETACLDV